MSYFKGNGRNRTMTESTSYEMYPHKECFVCGRKWAINFMGHVEGRHLCPEHYNSIIQTYGIYTTLEEIQEDSNRLKKYYVYFVTSINNIAKYEKYYNIKLLDLVITKHKELITQQGKEVNTITKEENNSILLEINNNYLLTIVPKKLTIEELKNIHIDKSYYSIYYEKLTGRRSKVIGGNQWLL